MKKCWTECGIFGLKTPEYERNNLRRAWNILTYLRKVGRHAQAFAEVLRPDAVIASSTYPNDFALAKKIADFSGGRAYFEIHDLWPLSPMVLYHLKENNPLFGGCKRERMRPFPNRKKCCLSCLPQTNISKRGDLTPQSSYTFPMGSFHPTRKRRYPLPFMGTLWKCYARQENLLSYMLGALRMPTRWNLLFFPAFT